MRRTQWNCAGHASIEVRPRVRIDCRRHAPGPSVGANESSPVAVRSSLGNAWRKCALGMPPLVRIRCNPWSRAPSGFSLRSSSGACLLRPAAMRRNHGAMTWHLSKPRCRTPCEPAVNVGAHCSRMIATACFGPQLRMGRVSGGADSGHHPWREKCLQNRLEKLYFRA
jgi:hypothetical protein